MTRWLLAFSLMVLIPQQERPKPPDGWFCERPGPATPKDHECTCQRICSTDPNNPGTREDPKCQVYCHKDHCSCPIECP